jgi:NAD(P)-dependent dehydrogenase (short-subunit alcohol dehydrogenase family)
MLSMVGAAVMTRSLTGKVVAIIGGGRGIGAATAEALVKAGARVAILYDTEREARRAYEARAAASAPAAEREPG